MSHKSDRERFEQWMREVDIEVMNMAMCSVYDLADQPFYDWFANGSTPHEAAVDALDNESFPFELEEDDLELEGDDSDDW